MTEVQAYPHHVTPPQTGVVARAYSPRGSYWRQPFIRREALYVNEGDLIFTATAYDDTWQDNIEYYSEVDLLKIEEVRLISALTVPLPIDGGLIAFHPLPFKILLPVSLDLSSSSAQSLISTELRRQLNVREFAPLYDYLRFPPAWGGSRSYEVRADQMPLTLQHKAFDAIDTTDHLLIRGLNALLRCSMLMQYDMFLEEATYALYVGLEASFALVRRRMLVEGYRNPSAYDAAAWIDAAFNFSHESRYRYFEDFYDDRIRALHPESRFGVFPFAPLAVDDCYYLFKNLREVYNFLIFGEVIDRPYV